MRLKPISYRRDCEPCHANQLQLGSKKQTFSVPHGVEQNVINALNKCRRQKTFRVIWIRLNLEVVLIVMKCWALKKVMSYLGTPRNYNLIKLGLAKPILIIPHIARSNASLVSKWNIQRAVQTLQCQIENRACVAILAKIQI
jgi:hypothetical protein